MYSLKRSLVMFCLSALMPAGLLAQESIDCIEYTGSPDPRCAYVRIDDGRGVKLFVVPDGEDVISANALPNTDFFVYMPKASSDSVSAKLQADSSEVTHMRKVNSGEDRVVVAEVKGLYPIDNVVMGTAASEDGIMRRRVELDENWHQDEDVRSSSSRWAIRSRSM